MSGPWSAVMWVHVCHWIMLKHGIAFARSSGPYQLPVGGGWRVCALVSFKIAFKFYVTLPGTPLMIRGFVISNVSNGDIVYASSQQTSIFNNIVFLS